MKVWATLTVNKWSPTHGTVSVCYLITALHLLIRGENKRNSITSGALTNMSWLKVRKYAAVPVEHTKRQKVCFCLKCFFFQLNQILGLKPTLSTKKNLKWHFLNKMCVFWLFVLGWEQGLNPVGVVLALS